MKIIDLIVNKNVNILITGYRKTIWKRFGKI